MDALSKTGRTTSRKSCASTFPVTSNPMTFAGNSFSSLIIVVLRFVVGGQRMGNLAAQIEDEPAFDLAMQHLSHRFVDFFEAPRFAHDLSAAVGVELEGFLEVDAGPHK